MEIWFDSERAICGSVFRNNGIWLYIKNYSERAKEKLVGLLANWGL